MPLATVAAIAIAAAGQPAHGSGASPLPQLAVQGPARMHVAADGARDAAQGSQDAIHGSHGAMHGPQGTMHAAQQAANPYAGQHRREVKSLSDAEIRDLREGRGMGLARAAELNGYPGPMHVLELDAQLGLSDAQREATRALLAPMRERARTAGERLIEAERELERLFAERRATPEAVDAALQRIAGLQAEVRAAHLDAHLKQAAILTPQQIERYRQLRGYGG